METLRAERLLRLTPSTLGASGAQPGTLAVRYDPARAVWRVTWRDPQGRPQLSESPVGQSAWSKAAAGKEGSTDESGPSTHAAPLPDGVLDCVRHPHGRAALRSGRRVVGKPPRFPSASLVFARERAGAWHDVALADEPPEADLGAAVLAGSPQHFLAAYIIAAGNGAHECRVVEVAESATAAPSAAWTVVPPYPQAPGMAGAMVGMHRNVLIAAGGANFPDLPPWEGGKKKFYSEIFVLLPNATAWVSAGHLPVPRAYGAVASVADGVLIAGGENDDQIFGDTLLLQWDGTRVHLREAPKLPSPITCAAAVILDGHLYLCGGYGPGQPRLSAKPFWSLAVANRDAGWKVLPAWPGPTRALAVMSAVGGAVYLISGIEIAAAPGKTPPEAGTPVYLKDAYRFRPGAGWEKLPDLPWSALAAPTPAPVTYSPSRVFVLGGVDGRQVGQLPRATALPNDILYFEAEKNRWQLWPEPWPTPVVCLCTVENDSRWIMISGETMAGKRTTAVTAWNLER